MPSSGAPTRRARHRPGSTGLAGGRETGGRGGGDQSIIRLASSHRTAAVPKLFNPRTDPYERADITFSRYWQWIVENAYKLAAALTSGL
jgi:hypothetical protein